jgi:hypothetical protein
MKTGNKRDVVTAAGVSSIPVATTDVVYTQSVKIENAESFGLWVLASSAAGTPALKIEIQQSALPPTTEGSADTNYVVPDGVADVVSALNDELAHEYAIFLVPLPYLRFKITGLSSPVNPSDSLVQMKLFVQ